jgi:hypothetical protein
MRVVTVATHNERMFDAFQSSCKKNNCVLDVLGMGQPWKGFAWRWTLLLEYLNNANIEDYDVILVTDAFDSLILEHADVIENKFKSFNSGIVFSCEPFADKMFAPCAYYRYRVFGKDPIINGGTYIGYAVELRKFINNLKYTDKSDDQRIFTALHKHIKMTVDDKNLLFFHNCWGTKVNVPENVAVITFPASGYTKKILAKLGYDYNSSVKADSCTTTVSTGVRRCTHYSKFFYFELSIILAFGLLILTYMRVQAKLSQCQK